MTSIYDYLSKDLYVTSSVKQNADGTSSTVVSSGNIPGGEIQSEMIVSGEVDGNLSFIGGFIQSKNFVTGTSGWRISADGTVEFGSGTFRGSITGSTINIPNSTSPLFSVDSSGNVTAIGISTLNKKAFTNFETAGRFVGTVGGTGTNTFGNQGVTIAPGALATSFTKLLWDIANVYTNNPTFTCTVNVLSVNSGDARCYIGMGQPSVTGSGITYGTTDHIGFSLNKTTGVLTLSSENGNSGGSVGANITTLVAGDIVELFIKVTATSIKYYYRKNGGTLTLGDTQTTRIPTATGESSLLFATSNAGTANDIQLILQCAAYEH